MVGDLTACGATAAQNPAETPPAAEAEAFGPAAGTPAPIPGGERFEFLSGDHTTEAVE